MNSDAIFYVFIALMLVFLFLSSRKRKKSYQDLMASLEIGSEVMLTSGIFGKIADIDGDHLIIEIAPKTPIKVLRGAIAKVIVNEAAATEPNAQTKTKPTTKK